MLPLRDLPIKWKMLLILLLTAGTVLLTSGAVITLYEVRSFRRNLGEHLQSLAQITAANSSGAVMFDDPALAAHILSALENEPGIQAAALHLPRGERFAGYLRPGETDPLPSRPAPDGLHREGDRLLLVHPVTYQGERIGTLCMASSLDELRVRLRVYAATLLLASAAAMGLALVLSTRLQRLVTEPLLHLTALARAVSERKDYTLRARREGRDELAQLASGFNGMLEQIQAREASLEERNRQLRTSLEEVSDLYNHAPCGYHSVDAEGRFVRVNDTELAWLGYTREELLGRLRHVDLMTPDSQLRYVEAFAELRRTGEIRNLEFELRRKDGSILPVMLSASAVLDEAGRFLASRSTLVDITERRRAEEQRIALERQVQHAQKLESLGLLAGGFAHDFNNLLTAILANLDMVGLDLPAEGRTQARLEQARTASLCAADLCRQILAFSGRGSFVVTHQDLNGLVRDMTRLLEASIPKKLSLVVDLQEDLPPILADASQLHQVLMNLVVNAADAIGDREGRICISTRLQHCDGTLLSMAWQAEELPEGAYVLLEVTDDGEGMGPETLANIFNPFFTTKVAGRGLGLAAVQGILRGHKGAIHVYSELHKGTTFKLYFPAAAGATSAPRPVREPEVLPQASGTILLVDDEPILLDVETAILERLGFTILTAADGLEGLEVFRAHREEIRLVILDLTMPRMDGAETFRELRRLDATLPVVIASGYTEQEVHGLFSGTDVAGFIQKPFTAAALAAKLAELLPPRPSTLEGAPESP